MRCCSRLLRGAGFIEALARLRLSGSGEVMTHRSVPFWKTLVPIICSGLLLALLYSKVDLEQLRQALGRVSWPVFVVALGVGGLLSILSGWRYSFFANVIGVQPSPGYGSSLKSYFIAASFNLLLPSKLGDLGKGALCARIDRCRYPIDLHLFTLYEKVSDLFALLLLGVLLALCSAGAQGAIPALAPGGSFAWFQGVLLLSTALLVPVIIPHRRGGFLAASLKPLPRKLREAALFATHFSWAQFLAFQAVSLALWALHLVQMALFAQCLGMSLWSPSGLLALIASVVVGLLPISFAGIGPRDGALAVLLKPLYGAVQPLLLGVLLTSRYVLPALVGLPLLRELAAPAPDDPPLSPPGA